MWDLTFVVTSVCQSSSDLEWKEGLLAFLRWPRAKKGLHCNQCLLTGQGQLWLPSEAPTTFGFLTSGPHWKRPVAICRKCSVPHRFPFAAWSVLVSFPALCFWKTKPPGWGMQDKAPTGLGDWGSFWKGLCCSQGMRGHWEWEEPAQPRLILRLVQMQQPNRLVIRGQRSCHDPNYF